MGTSGIVLTCLCASCASTNQSVISIFSPSKHTVLEFMCHVLTKQAYSAEIHVPCERRTGKTRKPCFLTLRLELLHRALWLWPSTAGVTRMSAEAGMYGSGRLSFMSSRNQGSACPMITSKLVSLLIPCIFRMSRAAIETKLAHLVHVYVCRRSRACGPILIGKQVMSAQIWLVQKCHSGTKSASPRHT
jgi:hypothetical protein